MSQSYLETSFTQKTHRQIYFEVAPDNPAITADGKIVIIAEESKGIDHVIANDFETANATAVVLLARNKTDLEDAKTLLKSVFTNTVFCYCPVDITNSIVVAAVFYSICVTLGESNVLILCGAYFHLLKLTLDLSANEMDQSFEVNFKANVNLVRQFYNPEEEYNQVKILINMSVVAAHTQHFNMSAYDASKAALIYWLEHVHVENHDRLRVHHMHLDIVQTDLLQNREIDADDWDWENDKSKIFDWQYNMIKLIKFLSQSSGGCGCLVYFSWSRLFGGLFYLG